MIYYRDPQSLSRFRMQSQKFLGDFVLCIYWVFHCMQILLNLIDFFLLLAEPFLYRKRWCPLTPSTATTRCTSMVDPSAAQFIIFVVPLPSNGKWRVYRNPMESPTKHGTILVFTGKVGNPTYSVSRITDPIEIQKQRVSQHILNTFGVFIFFLLLYILINVIRECVNIQYTVLRCV